MTQMGLDYLKHREQARHNVETERISQQEADTHSYSASFEPERVAATVRSSFAAESQAKTAAAKQSLEERYREREMVAKEQSTAATVKQAEVAAKRADFDQLKEALETMGETNAYDFIQRKIDKDGQFMGIDRETWNRDLQSEAGKTFATGVNATNFWLDKLFGMLRLSVKKSVK